MIDLRAVPQKVYTEGQRIIGDLKYMGWVIISSIRMTEPTYLAVDTITYIGNRRFPISTTLGGGCAPTLNTPGTGVVRGAGNFLNLKVPKRGRVGTEKKRPAVILELFSRTACHKKE